MIRNSVLLTFLLAINSICYSQVILNADGKSNTQQLIADSFAPGYHPIESPGFEKNDCDNHSGYNQEHISQVYDSILKKYVFKFSIHLKEDNDRCKKFDRQRNEIKGYRKSPETMKGTLGETVTYEWTFKLSEDFAPSKNFTHLHQIKSVGEKPKINKPIFTLSARKIKGSDVFQLQHSKNGQKADVLHQINLNLFKGNWVTVIETITYHKNPKKGKYKVLIKDTLTSEIIFEYKNTGIQTWYATAEFKRPKWGIYRSLKDSSHLKDEDILFDNFKITESK